MNTLLRHQIASFISNQKDVQPELMDLFVTISSTYDFYESKLGSGKECDESTANEPVPGQVCTIAKPRYQLLEIGLMEIKRSHHVSVWRGAMAGSAGLPR